MPLVHAADDDDNATEPAARSSMSSSKKVHSSTTAADSKSDNHDDDNADTAAAAASAGPLSPRVRRRLSDAKESASLFNPVCTQGEVIQWMSACHPDLIEFGRELERRGYHTLSSIAFLTEDDIDVAIDAPIKQLLLATLSRLRHEFFRM